MASKLALLGGTPTVTEAWPPWPDLGEDDIEAVARVIRERRISALRREGVIAEFEDRFAATVDAEHALTFSSGTSSIHAACFACGVAPGDEVLTTSYTWISAITAILHANAVPVFCDVAPGSFHIDPAEITRKAGGRARAVIVTHIWGLPAPMDAIVPAARAAGLKIIEDASHAHGGRFRGRALGTIGDVGCFSLQGTKAVPAGEGGVLVTNDRLIYERAMIPGHHDQRLRSCLTDKRTRPFARAGGYWKYRAAPMAMALACSQLTKLDERHEARRANFNRLADRLRGSPILRLASASNDDERAYYGYPGIYTHDRQSVSRDLLLQALAAEGAMIFPGYDNWYQTPVLQDMSLFRQLWVSDHVSGAQYRPLPIGSLPVTDGLVESTVLFPAWAKASPELVDQYANACHKVAAHMDTLAEIQCERGRA